jgi:hypothetical protein
MDFFGVQSVKTIDELWEKIYKFFFKLEKVVAAFWFWYLSLIISNNQMYPTTLISNNGTL